MELPIFAFTDLPVPGRLLIDEPRWIYPSACAAGRGTAQLHVWEAANSAGYLAIVTETSEGATITNSAEPIWASLRRVLRDGQITVLEHWPASQAGGSGEHLDQVTVSARGVHWRRIWPTGPENPGHSTFEAWMIAYGQDLLGQSSNRRPPENG
jgi:hypothetical protein